MKVHVSEIRNAKGFRKVVLLLIISPLLIAIPLYVLNISPFSLYSPELSPVYHSMTADVSNRVSVKPKSCDISKGKWVPYAKGPYYYTNSTRCVVDDRQNCMRLGRPDAGFMKWRWKPDQCELSHFDAKEFLELVRGKSMAFVGDSVGRNQVESLMCLLANVAHPVDDAPSLEGLISRWFYSNYNFTLGLVWSPNLVKSSIGNRNGSSVVGLFNLYLDKVDEGWTSKIKDFDYLIISVGHWFSRPLIYHEKGKVIGCHMCQDANILTLSRYYGYRKALRTAFKAISGIPNFKGVTILRAFSPTHFGSDDWVRGNCSRTTPFGKEEMVMDANNLEYYLTQVDEFRTAEREGRKRGLRFMLLDVFEAMGMRPDGHPYHYGHPQNKREAIADCLHWCLPGPIDSWNEFLLHMLKVEAQRD
ncbi:protein trichome birefringence-like 19 [Rhododendron vialii]|uniref:protein trichome birefringence-like 19 n=1 Tax=Rhododendron vialii TaxID=182163 RepID=UPI00265E27DE|nr:protein trichome birefringence-like 19 [Rhododendron vialii]